MKSLGYLLTPYSVEKFLTEDWTRKAVWIPAETPTKLQHLFSWKHLNYLLNFHQIKYPDLRFSLDGKTLPEAQPERWCDLLQQGATMIVNGVHQRVPELAAFAAEINREIGYRTQINLYCSPTELKGFDCHFDTHEVLILQIEGQKEWFVFPETIAYPTSQDRSSDRVPPDTPPYLQCTLDPGDVLYIPRGHWHYAIACGNSDREAYSPSLHLTLGIDCQTGLNWLSWLLEECQKAPEWRQNLPLILKGDNTEIKQHLEMLRDRLIESVQNPDSIERYLHRLSYCDRPPLPFALPSQLGSGIFQQGLETRFFTSSLHSVQILKISDRHAQVIVGSKQATIKGITTDLVDKLFRPGGFSLLDLAEWAPSLDIETEVIPLLTNLVTQGILFVDSGD